MERQRTGPLHQPNLLEWFHINSGNARRQNEGGRKKALRYEQTRCSIAQSNYSKLPASTSDTIKSERETDREHCPIS